MVQLGQQSANVLPTYEAEDAHTEGDLDVLHHNFRHPQQRQGLERLNYVAVNLEGGVTMSIVSSQVLVVGIEHAARVDIVNDEAVCDLLHDDVVALARSVVQ